MSEELQRRPPDVFEKGTWQRYLAHTAEPECRPFWSALICCKECGKYLNLYNHKIAPDGQVTPSVGHPDGYPACSWHPTPRLLGWVDEPAPPASPLTTCERCGIQRRNLGGWGTWSKGTGLICADCFKAHMDECRVPT